MGETTAEPDGPVGEKPFPVPLQAVALALVQTNVDDSPFGIEVGDDSPFGIEVGDADNVTVGAAALACALSCASTCPEVNSV